MIFYIAKVQDTDGVWHRKVGKTSLTVSKRFSDKRLYLDHEDIASRQFSEKYIDEVENEFKEYTIGKKHKDLNIPAHFMGKTEIIKEEVTTEMLLDKLKNLKIPSITTLEDF
jgi:hypothetical protein